MYARAKGRKSSLRSSSAWLGRGGVRVGVRGKGFIQTPTLPNPYPYAYAYPTPSNPDPTPTSAPTPSRPTHLLHLAVECADDHLLAQAGGVAHVRLELGLGLGFGLGLGLGLGLGSRKCAWLG